MELALLWTGDDYEVVVVFATAAQKSQAQYGRARELADTVCDV